MSDLTRTTAEDSIRALETAGELLAIATERELELQSLRGLRKNEAVRRIMAAQKIAATPAEKVVETDPEYSAFLKECRSSVADRIRAEARFSAEKLRAYLTVRLELAFS
jgi:hypothetical protein